MPDCFRFLDYIPQVLYIVTREKKKVQRGKKGRDNKRHLVVKSVQDVANYTTILINYPIFGKMRYPALLHSRRGRINSLRSPWNVFTKS